MEIKKILVVADRKDDHTLIALKRAASMLEDAKAASIHLVGFVYEGFVEKASLLSKDESEKYKEQMLKHRTDSLKQLVKTPELAKLNIQSEVVWQREIDKWIVSRSGKYDLIIKTGNRTESMWYMPTDWKLMRECLSPTYIVARKSWKKRPIVLATIDFDSRSRAQQSLNRDVLAEAALVSQRLDAELHISHIVAVSRVLADMDLVDSKKLRKSFVEKSKPKLLALAEEYGVEPGNVHIGLGTPHKEIPRLANKLKTELVVMGGFGRKGAKAAVLGNTAEQVISVLRTDILVVRRRS